jgi:NAD-dependent SIR2 family protein deacetylase
MIFLFLRKSYFREHPQAFYLLAKELYPGQFKATAAHHFIRLLHDKGMLLRNYTQNIDTLEQVAAIPPESLVFAHGSFQTASCIDCHKQCTPEYIKGECESVC